MMINKTKSNFNEAVEILVNQAFIPQYKACTVANNIFKQVRYDRTVKGLNSTVEDYLLKEINKVDGEE